MFKVYKHVNLINGKIYIGITEQTTEERWENGNGYKGQVFYNAIKKYSWDNFKHIILFDHLTESEALEIEIELIAYHKSYLSCNGYNADMGGKYAGKHSEATRKKISQNTKRHPVICIETKDFFESCVEAAKKMNLCYSSIAKNCKGNRRYQSVGGYHFIYADQYDENTDYNLKIGCGYEVICLETGRIFTSATKAGRLLNLDVSSICKVCNNKKKSVGRLHFKFLKDYDSNKKYDLKCDRDFIKRKIICIETKDEFDSIKEAGEKMNLHANGICAVLKGRQKTTGGYHFKYID